ncbi:hypothetical protein GCM10010425_44650 [Streptomyces spororaveus]|uniref:Secreted protein n=1 Tax=Streptomyces spororaveus TaxID=284039 RepID=A0ABQ3TM94_9ACTN|nr:hypothetical protein Sspor_71020 [Streptomyces spororaveus]
MKPARAVSPAVRDLVLVRVVICLPLHCGRRRAPSVVLIEYRTFVFFLANPWRPAHDFGTLDAEVCGVRAGAVPGHPQEGRSWALLRQVGVVGVRRRGDAGGRHLRAGRNGE